MFIAINFDTLQLRPLSNRQWVQRREAKRGDGLILDVGFYYSADEEAEPGAMPEGTTFTFGAKEAGNYNASPVILSDEFEKIAYGAGWIYRARVSLNTAELATLVGDSSFVDLMAEVTWLIPDYDPVTCETFTLRVNNDIVRGDEGTPSAINAILEFEDDAAKLAAATTPRIGQLVRITGEADRIEQFLGGDASEQTSWLVLQNTVDLTVTNYSGSDVTVNGVTCDTDETTNVGWVNPAAVSYIAPDGGTMNSQADDSFDCACASGTNFSTGGTFALPFATKSRSAVTLSIGGA